MKKSELKFLIKEVIKTMMIKEYSATIKDPETGDDIDVEIDYDYHRGSMGRRTGMDRFAEPDEPSHVTINSITMPDGRVIDGDELDDATREKLENEIVDRMEEMNEAPVESPVKKKPDYRTQLRMAWQKAKREKNAEAMVYYSNILSSDHIRANVPFENFKGSWAYGEWLKKPETQEAINDIQRDLKRFSYLE
jgi:hypothetical protein